MIQHGELFRRDLIPEYFADPIVWTAIGWWERWRTFGLPFAGGWADQPGIFLEAVEACEGAWRMLTAGSSKQGGNRG